MAHIRLSPPGEHAIIRGIDDDASALYTELGLNLQFEPDHPFVVAEQQRWLQCAERGSLFVALEGELAVGFAALERLDGRAHLEQLSVRSSFGRRGIGKSLLETAFGWAKAGPLTLTTYAHVPWNGPWYERMGFKRLSELTLELQARMDEERAVLPHPEQRIAMVR